MIVCIDCFKLFQTICTKTKLVMVRAANHSHHAQTSRRKNVFYILFERIIMLFLHYFEAQENRQRPRQRGEMQLYHRMELSITPALDIEPSQGDDQTDELL